MYLTFLYVVSKKKKCHYHSFIITLILNFNYGLSYQYPPFLVLEHHHYPPGGVTVELNLFVTCGKLTAAMSAILQLLSLSGTFWWLFFLSFSCPSTCLFPTCCPFLGYTCKSTFNLTNDPHQNASSNLLNKTVHVKPKLILVNPILCIV